MMRQSAGILLYRIRNHEPEVFLVHPGGPIYKNKDAGYWSIPKGEFADDEAPLTAAIREFEEETSFTLKGKFTALDPIKQKSGKTVYAWANEGNLDPTALKSNLFEMEWPPKSGKMQSFPEIDKGDWFGIAMAKEKILPSQRSFITQLLRIIDLV